MCLIIVFVLISNNDRYSSALLSGDYVTILRYAVLRYAVLRYASRESLSPGM